jgi:opacity protein-like surface antigen
VRPLLTLVAFLCAVPASPQGFELTALGGYTTPAGLKHDSRTVEDLQLSGSSTWGATAGYFLSPRFGVEASWARVGSGVELSTTAATQEMFDVTIDQLQGSFVYQLGRAESRWRPFLVAGAGVAILNSSDVESESKLSFNVGAGVKWLPRRRFGVRLQAKYNPTFLNDGGSDFCAPLGFCQDWLHQFELTGGVVFRF